MSTTNESRQRAALERKLREHHDADAEAVLDVVDYLRDPGDTVLVGGSLAYGLGNGRSDLDIVIAGPRTAESSSRMPLEHWLGTLRVDVWKLMGSEIQDLFVRAEQALAIESPFQGAFGDVFEQADLKILHRLAFGVALDGPALRPVATRDFREIARDVVMREYAERMRDGAFVAQIALSAGRPRAAAASARFAVEDALQIAVAGRGLPFSDNKWLQTRLLDDVPELWATYAPFRRLPELEVDEFVASALRTCERMSGLDLRLEALIGAAEWRNGDLQAMAVGDRHLMLSARHGALWTLDARDVDAWERLDEDGTWPCRALDDDQMRVCSELHFAGLVALRWTRGIPVDTLALDPKEAQA